MQDMDTDLLNFDAFFAPNNDDEGNDYWNLATYAGHDDELLDMTELEPLSPVLKTELPEQSDHVPIKQEVGKKLGLKLDTTLINNAKADWRAQFENAKANGTPTASLPARFALLSTTCVYEPGFTTSPRGKRRISQTQGRPFGFQNEEKEEEQGDEDEDEANSDDASGEEEPFLLASDEYNLPVFTDAELAAMVESPSKFSAASTLSAVPSPLDGLDTPALAVVNALATEEQEIPEVISMFHSIFANSPAFQPHLLETGHSSTPALLETASENPLKALPSADTAATATCAVPFDYFSPSSYAAAANQFLDSYGQQVQPFFFHPEPVTSTPPFLPCQATSSRLNPQFATAMSMANAAAINTMLKMHGNYGVPIAPMDFRGGAAPSKGSAVKPLQRAVSASSKGSRLAITPDIADFKLVQIFHHFCDPATSLLTLPRFQQLLNLHQVKEEAAMGTRALLTDESPNAPLVVTSDAETIFQALDRTTSGVLDLERFMHSFQICNRCTETKRRAHQALCASQGKAFTPTALERQLMEDVAPVVVRVVPTRFEGHKVKSCDHYQWTWCEGFDKTGNEKCRGTNRHDKCPKYLANCTLWKHKLPPKSRKPKLELGHVDSPTKKLKHFT